RAGLDWRQSRQSISRPGGVIALSCPLMRADVQEPLVLASHDPPQSAPAKAGSSLLGALVIVARHRGIHLSQSQLHRDHRLGPGDPLTTELLQIAQARGMRAVATRLKFRDLMRLAGALPAILLLKNGSAMVLLRSEPQAQLPHVVAQDPAAG